MNVFENFKEKFRQVINEITDFTVGYRKIKKDYPIYHTVNALICSGCGGKCCKRCGCHYSPNDFAEISFEFLKKELEKGYISIEYIEPKSIFEKKGCYILRIRNRGADVVEKNYYKTPCLLLTETGCKLDYNERPTGGRLIIPGKSGCKSKYTKNVCFKIKKESDYFIIRFFFEYERILNIL